MYQYLSWFHRGKEHPSGNKLVSIDAISKLKPALISSGVEVHESVQRYDVTGRLLWTPIYADFDGEQSVDDVTKFVEMCQVDFDITPDIYFSGNRGWHTFINVPIEHSHPHLVVKKFMSIMSDSKYLDMQMYTSRHLLRSEGSIHFKTNLHKVRVNDTGFNRAMAKHPRVTEPTKHRSDILMPFLKGVIHDVDKEVAEAEEKYANAKRESNGEVAPCIRAIISEGPQAGRNNYLLTLIARAFNVANISLDDAIGQVMSCDVWSDRHREVAAVFKSTYRIPSRFGCKNNPVLNRHCDPFCSFNECSIDL